MNGFTVKQPGLLSLAQDSGRFGQHAIGLTNGGPLDGPAFRLCNRLLDNPEGATAVEVSFGGLELEAGVDSYICVTGASMPLSVNGEARPRYQVLPVRAGDRIQLGFSEKGARAYLGVANGFKLEPSFGSTATVPRESIGGLDGGKLKVGDHLPADAVAARPIRFLPPEHQPRITDVAIIRVIPGYQQEYFDRIQQRRFFSHKYV
ncbi:MAG: biotin-dependent carboxyltransferase family protein, partial [Pseudomonadota bacterium]